MGLKKHNPGCNCCSITCGWCTGDVPTQRSVTFANFTNGTCDNCTSLNTTFVLDFESCTGSYNTVGSVQWRYTGTTTCGGSTHDVEVFLFYSGYNLFSNAWRCQLIVTGTNSFGIEFISSPLVTPKAAYDCTAALNLAYSFFSGSGCSWSVTPTCLVAAA